MWKKWLIVAICVSALFWEAVWLAEYASSPHPSTPPPLAPMQEEATGETEVRTVKYEDPRSVLAQLLASCELYEPAEVRGRGGRGTETGGGDQETHRSGDQGKEKTADDGLKVRLMRLEDIVPGEKEEEAESLLSRSPSWYDNGILRTAGELEALRFSCFDHQSMRLTLNRVTRWPLVSEAQEYPLPVTWHSDSHLRSQELAIDLLGMPLVDSRSGFVLGAVVMAEGEGGEEGAWALQMLCTADAVEVLHKILTEPYPYWSVALRYDMLPGRQIDGSSTHLVLEQQEPSHYEILHFLNPYKPKLASDAAVEMSVVHATLREAYNYAWRMGIRVKIVAVVFEEDQEMVEYPYQQADRLLQMRFLDALGRKVPIMTEMLDRAWEDGGAKSEYAMWTNADIGAVRELYVDVWTTYGSYSHATSLTREQLPQEILDIRSWPISLEQVRYTTLTEGVEHPGDDCVILPAAWLPLISYGFVFPAFPPVACTLIDQLMLLGPVAKMRARDTFHLGLDDGSAWRKNADTVVGRHLNMHSTKEVFQRLVRDRFPYFLPVRHCFLMNWCADRLDLQMPRDFDLQDSPFEKALQCNEDLRLDLDLYFRLDAPAYVTGREGLYEEFKPAHAS